MKLNNALSGYDMFQMEENQCLKYEQAINFKLALGNLNH